VLCCGLWLVLARREANADTRRLHSCSVREQVALTPYRDANELESVNVDSIGIGWGMYCHLLDLGFPAVAVNVGERPRDSEKFANLKAELYWGLRLRTEAGDLSGLLDERALGNSPASATSTIHAGQAAKTLSGDSLSSLLSELPRRVAKKRPRRKQNGR
jgi:hypothetical protein